MRNKIEEKYPDLFKYCNKKCETDPVEDKDLVFTLITLLDQDFNDIFVLDVLNQIAEVENTDPATKFGDDIGVWQAFLRLLYHFLEMGSPSQKDIGIMREAIIELMFHRGRVEENPLSGFYYYLSLLPPVRQKDNSFFDHKPLSFLESIISGNPDYHPHLTWLDLLRYTAIHGDLLRQDRVDGRIKVFKLNWLENANIASFHYFLIDVNQSQHEPPKWVAVKIGDQQCDIYSEAKLRNSEQSKLEALLKANFPGKNLVHQGDKADTSVSSGYTALSWLLSLPEVQENLFSSVAPGRCVFTPEGNFWSMRDALLYDYAVWTGSFMGSDLVIAQFASNNFKKLLEAKLTLPELFEQITQASAVYGRDLQKVIAKVAKKPLEERASFLKQLAEEGKALTLVDKFNRLLHRYEKKVFSQDNERHQIICQLPQSDVDHVTLIIAAFNFYARNQKLVINYPKGHSSTTEGLNEKECAYLLNELTFNPYLQEIEFNDFPEDSALYKSLMRLKKEASAVLSRNHWLASNDYSPASMDDYWRQAFYYSLTYLLRQPSLFSTPNKHGPFFHTTDSMLDQGTLKFLEYLEKPAEKSRIEASLAGAKPPCYLYFASKDTLEIFITHLKQKKYFPFSEVGMNYADQASDEQLADLLTAINQQTDCKKIIFRIGNLEKLPLSLDFLLKKSITRAQSEGWKSLVVLEGLSSYWNLDPETYLRINQSLATLNNIILVNQRKQLNQIKLAELRSQLQSLTNLSPALSSGRLPSAANRLAEKVRKNILPGQKFSFRREEGAVLNFQMQQQVQASQQHQVQQTLTFLPSTQESLFDTHQLIEYDTIDKHLADYYAELKKTGLIDVDAEALPERQQNETELQTIFKLWISSNPSVKKAEHSIRYLTIDAAKKLLVSFKQTTFGLNTARYLSKGFFLSRNYKNELVLCYEPDRGYAGSATPLTVDFMYRPLAEPTSCLGDFRQLHLAKTNYDESEIVLSHEILHQMAVFAWLQPLEAHQQAKSLAERLSSEKLILLKEKFGDRLENYWLILAQAYQEKGEAAVDTILALEENVLQCNPQTVIAEFIGEQLFKAFYEVILALSSVEKNLQCLCQLYYSLDVQGISLMLEILDEVRQVLGQDGFESFVSIFLTPCANWSYLCEAKSFRALADMCQRLSRPEYAYLKPIWLQICQLHYQSVGVETPEALWNGFWYFVQQLEQNNVRLNLASIQQVKPCHMLVWMDRVLSSVWLLKDGRSKQIFLDTVHQYDLKAGGVYYALRYDGFRWITPDLQLTNFEKGSPTYSPNFSDSLTWEHSFFQVNVQRALAKYPFPQLTSEGLSTLSQYFSAEDSKVQRALFVCFWFTSHQPSTIETTIRSMNPLKDSVNSSATKEALLVEIANTLLEIEQQTSKPKITLESLKICLDNEFFQATFQKIQPELRLALLEACSVLYDRHSCDNTSPEEDVEKIVKVVLALNEVFSNTSNQLNQEAKKNMRLNVKCFDHNAACKAFFTDLIVVAACFNQLEFASLEAFASSSIIRLGRRLRMLSIQGLNQFFSHLRSINVLASQQSALKDPENWQKLAGLMSNYLKKDHKNWPNQSVELLNHLQNSGIVFNKNYLGKTRRLNENDYVALNELNIFDREKALFWSFLYNYIVVPDDIPSTESLSPFFEFFKELRANSTNADELQVLLSILTRSAKKKITQEEKDCFWDVRYLLSFLQSFQETDPAVPYPIGLVNQLLLTIDQLKPLPFDSDDRNCEFPLTVQAKIKAIHKNSQGFSANEAIVIQLALHEHTLNSATQFTITNWIICELAKPDPYNQWCRSFIEYGLSCSEVDSFYQVYEKMSQLLELGSTHEKIKEALSENCALWCNYLLQTQQEKTPLVAWYFSQNFEDEKTKLIFHLIAVVTFCPKLISPEEHKKQLKKTAPKLLKQLEMFSEDELVELASSCTKEIAITPKNLLDMCKQVHAKNISLEAGIHQLACDPHGKIFWDYGTLSDTRAADFCHMVSEAELIIDGQKRLLSVGEIAKLTFSLSYLKLLESGDERINGKKISDLNQQELIKMLHDLGHKQQKDFRDHVLIAALLFLALGRSMGKYPTLAQQFAFIAPRIVFNDSQLSFTKFDPGEGKSILIALESAYKSIHKEVIVCSNKVSLIQRDLEENKSFFTYLQIKFSDVTAKSHPNILDNRIVLATPNQLSHFCQTQMYAGVDVEERILNRDMLIDEFDYLYFEQQKTDVNFSLLEESSEYRKLYWFFTSVNEFYAKLHEEKAYVNGIFDDELLIQFADHLEQTAGTHPERQIQLKRLVGEDSAGLIEWLQSAHMMYSSLARRIDFDLNAANEKIPFRIVVPRSLDGQPLPEANFSDGVQQLLVTRSNEEARENGEYADIYADPLGIIVDSQTIHAILHRFFSKPHAFSGSLSALQTNALCEQTNAQILYIPPNQPSQRKLKFIDFFADEKSRFDVVAEQIKACFDHKRSILFCCKNDEMVMFLKKELEKRLPTAYFQQIIFHINEDMRSVKDIMVEKKRKEGRTQEGKECGAGLASSGLSRGDNPLVDEVFLFNSDTQYAYVQEVGRGARGGQIGNVREFYIWPDVEKAHTLALEKATHLNQNIQALLASTTLTFFNESLDDKKIRMQRELLYLNEYIALHKDKINEFYRNTYANYSHWMMKVFCQLAAKNKYTEKLQLTDLWTVERRALKSEWLKLADNSACAEKDIVDLINSRAQRFCEKIATSIGSETELQLAPFVASIHSKPLQPPETTLELDDKDISLPHKKLSLLSITEKLVSIPLPRNTTRIENFFASLDNLKPQDNESFLNKIEFAQTFDQLEEAVQQASVSSSITLEFPYLELKETPIFHKIADKYGKDENDAAFIKQLIKEATKGSKAIFRERMIGHIEILLTYLEDKQQVRRDFLVDLCTVMKKAHKKTQWDTFNRLFFRMQDDNWLTRKNKAHQNNIIAFWHLLAGTELDIEYFDLSTILNQKTLGKEWFQWPLAYFQWLDAITIQANWEKIRSILNENFSTTIFSSKMEKLKAIENDFSRIASTIKPSPAQLPDKVAFKEPLELNKKPSDPSNPSPLDLQQPQLSASKQPINKIPISNLRLGPYQFLMLGVLLLCILLGIVLTFTPISPAGLFMAGAGISALLGVNIAMGFGLALVITGIGFCISKLRTPSVPSVDKDTQEDLPLDAPNPAAIPLAGQTTISRPGSQSAPMLQAESKKIDANSKPSEPRQGGNPSL